MSNTDELTKKLEMLKDYVGTLQTNPVKESKQIINDYIDQVNKATQDACDVNQLLNELYSELENLQYFTEGTIANIRRILK